VTLVVWPVGLRIVGPGNVPRYVHMLVHGPSNICTHASWMRIDTSALVVTGGKRNRCEKGVGVGVGVGVVARLGPMPLSAPARMSGSKVLGEFTSWVFINFQKNLGTFAIYQLRVSHFFLIAHCPRKSPEVAAPERRAFAFA
jgi:hypothetical protein